MRNLQCGGKFGGPDYYERTKQGGIMEQFRQMKQKKEQGKENENDKQ